VLGGDMSIVEHSSNSDAANNLRNTNPPPRRREALKAIEAIPSVDPLSPFEFPFLFLTLWQRVSA